MSDSRKQSSAKVRELKLVNTLMTELAGTILCLVVCREASCAVKLDFLREAVRTHEIQYNDFSVSISKMHWEISTNQLPTSVETRRIVQWQDYYYSCICNNRFTSRSISRAFQFTVCHGDTLTTYTPPGVVEHQMGSYLRPARFQPYDVLLGALGHEMTLSKFLSGDDSTLNLMQFDVGEVEDFEGLKTLPVRRVFQLPGDQYAKIIDLRLAVDYAYLPCWGESITVTGDTRRLNAKSVVTKFLDVRDGRLPLMSEMRTRTYSELSEHGDDLLTITQIEGEALSQMPPRDLFELKSFVGNPTIRYLRDRQLQTESLYRPKQIKKEPWPAEITWLVINDIAIGIWLVICSFAKVLKYVNRLQLCCRAT